MSENIKWGMVIDVSKCIACHACTASCRIENKLSTDQNRSWVIETEVGAYPNVHVLKVAQLCNHCEKTPCIEACPVAATGKNEEGIVFIDKEKCIGCYACVEACPYGARIKDQEAKKVDKCDFCAHRLENGLLPVCISTCTTQARYFGDLNDPNSLVSKLLKENKYEVLLPEKELEPNVYYIGIEEYKNFGK
ncbi:4Fe-4S dicluster domain-containing protein [Tissierella carlieri]|uniref:4Fe-4S dicluster domain-containing protein n=1 Tax=Tissierella carlieri TaxID=689904 RepID=A0ABT1SGQ2_9FIRM|nr:4Fe-4S dicluster domain-containing protein [Tissierella carlieri]MCQ4925661.1 4Fe-4S dicluster domain-containing protein [Tissierella carlieri]